MNAVPDQLDTLRQRGETSFANHGMPTRRVEAWRYTPVQNLVPDADRGMESVLPAMVESEEIPGLTITRLEEALEKDDGRLYALLNGLDTEHPALAFNALNNAGLWQGLVIEVAPGADVGRLQLDWQCDQSPDELASKSANARLCILVGEGARLEIVESFRRANDAGLLNLVIQAEVGARGHLRHSRVQSEAQGSALITRTIINQAEGSAYHYTGLDLGDGLTRHDLQARLNGEGAHCELNGAYLPTGQAHVDNHLEIEHIAPNCSSSQFYRGVMNDRSRAVFNGRVHVHVGADGAEARQSNANLLLSDHAEVNTKPELEIETDEVVASHGATVGQLDEEAVFYLRSRGLDEDAARGLLTGAFCQAVIDVMPEGEVREQFTRDLSHHLESRA